jgi:preprotein translocase subunit YajC
MLISPAWAQAAGAEGPGALEALLPIILIFVVFYFLLIRPQQKKMKNHKEMLGSIRRGDRIVTGGGIIGTVAKVIDDHEVSVDVADNVRVRVRRELISTVLAKTEPAPQDKQDKDGKAAQDKDGKPSDANDDNNQPQKEKPKGGMLGGLLGGGKKKQ